MSPNVSRANRVQAGVLAVGAATTVVNAFIYLGGPLAEVLLVGPRSVVALALTFPVEPLFLLLSIVLVTLVGVACGAIDERLPPAWPYWLHGFAFAALPLITSLLLLTPLFLFWQRATLVVAGRRCWGGHRVGPVRCPARLDLSAVPCPPRGPPIAGPGRKGTGARRRCALTRQP